MGWTGCTVSVSTGGLDGIYVDDPSLLRQEILAMQQQGRLLGWDRSWLEGVFEKLQAHRSQVETALVNTQTLLDRLDRAAFSSELEGARQEIVEHLAALTSVVEAISTSFELARQQYDSLDS